MFSGKKLLLLGFIIVLLAGIPLTLYVAQQQQELRSQAEKSTTLSVSTTKTTAKVGETIPVDIMVDPGNNLVSFVKLEITYDPTKLSIDESAFVPNPAAFPVTVESAFSSGKILVSLSIGPVNLQPIGAVTKVASLSFKALETTSGSSTTIGLGSQTQALSSGENEQAKEDVLSTTNPARITITGDTVVTTTPTTTITQPLQPTATTAPTATTTAPIGGAGPTNQPPTCTALNIDRATSGEAPYSLTFTALGEDSDGTIGQVSFNFGDGPVTNVTTGGGIGTKTINTQIAHTYNNPGTYNAYVIMSDSNGAVSNFNSCKTTITVTAAAGQSGGTTAQTAQTPATQTTIEPTGPSTVVVGAGALVGLLSIIGAVTFFLF